MQGFELIGKMNISNYDPMKLANSSFRNSMMNLGSSFDATQTLQGQVQIEVPKDLNSLQDKQLAQDLKQVISPVEGAQAASSVGAINSPDSFFKCLNRAMSDGISNVNKLQIDAEKKIETFATGGNIDIHSVMIASQKANLSLEMAMQLRNKLVGAYKEITRMQL